MPLENNEAGAAKTKAEIIVRVSIPFRIVNDVTNTTVKSKFSGGLVTMSTEVKNVSMLSVFVSKTVNFHHTFEATLIPKK